MAFHHKFKNINWLETVPRGILLVEPVLPVLFLLATPVLAEVFGADAQTLGRGFVEFIVYARRWIYLFGVLAVFWGVANLWMGKPFVMKFVGAGACFGAPSIITTLFEFSQGRRVDMDTNLPS